MPSPRSRAVPALLLLAGSVLLAACEQPLTVRAAPAPDTEAQISAAAAIVGHVDPSDLSRARTGLDALAAAWGSPAATALHAQAAGARRDAEAFARTVDPRPGNTVAEALRAAAARPARPVRP